VARHAEAGDASVQLVTSSGYLELIVTDAGRGIRLPQVLRNGRPTTGMASMRERAALVGGTLEIGPAADGGTRVYLRVPITDAQSAVQTEHD
jgi:two-component system sensor histidine kinase UhpB